MEIAQTIDESLKEWYSEQGKEVPVWKTRDPQWWIDYLSELGDRPQESIVYRESHLQRKSDECARLWREWESLWRKKH